MRWPEFKVGFQVMRKDVPGSAARAKASRWGHCVGVTLGEKPAWPV